MPYDFMGIEDNNSFCNESPANTNPEMRGQGSFVSTPQITGAMNEYKDDITPRYTDISNTQMTIDQDFSRRIYNDSRMSGRGV